MTNKIYKNGSLPFVIDAYDQSVYDSKIIFSTQDVGTARLVFKLRKDGRPLPLSAVEGKLVLLFSNGSKHIRNISLLDKVEGVAEYILNKDEIKIFGRVQASLNLFYKNGQSMSVHEFIFDIKKNLIDENIVPAAEYYIDHFDSLKSKIEQKSAELEAEIKKRTDVMQGNIDEITKELREQLDRMKEKLDDLDSLETKKGAQAKADDTLKKAKEYVDPHLKNNKIHVTETEKNNWNQGQLYRLTPNDGRIARVPNGTDIFKLPTGPYMGAQLLNVPVPNDLSFYYIDVFDTSYEQNGVVYKRIVATRSFDNITWVGTFHAQGFKGWERIITSGDAKTDYKFPTILNGWKTYKSEVNNDYRVRYTKDALGWVHISGAIAGGTLGDVPAFVLDEGYRPAAPLYNVGLASSTGGASGPQICRQYITTDGRYCIQMTSSNTEFIVVNFSFKV
ncbi:BppU family phage baseplate upper protein [Bacillus aerius]|uniref:BppU family phage baseplate upper protein n=1 Tax=Bacillus aerius TaxID=293388 RepID=UPI00344E9752